MIKVIQEDPHVTRCNYCRALLEYTVEDLLIGKEEISDKDYRYKYIDCPICGDEVRVT